MTQRCAALLAIAAILVVAGCGDDDEADGQGSADNAATETLTGSPLRIGAIVDASGPVAGEQGVVGPVLEAWAETVNADGGVAGHPVEVVVEDTKGDTPTATRIAQDFIDDDSILGIVFEDAATEVGVGELLSKSGLPVIGGLGFTPDIWHGLPNWFGITTSNPALTETGVIAAVEKGTTNVVAASCAEDPGCAEFAQILEQIIEKNGAEYRGQIKITAAQPNYTAECLEFMRAGADFIFAVSAPAEAVQVAEDCDRQGFEGWYGASAGTVAPEVYNTVPRVTGGLNAFPWYADAEPVQRFRDVMDEAGISAEEYGNTHATSAWSTMELFRKAMEDNAAGLGESPTREEVVDTYGTIKDETLGGLLPQPITFTPGEPAPPVNCFWLYSAEDGEITGSFEPSCTEES